MGFQQDHLELEVVKAPAPPSTFRKEGQIWPLILLSLLGICLGIGLCELTLRVLNKPRSEAIVAGWHYRGSDHFNQLHLRGRQFAYSDTSRVVLLLGDSQVEASACPDDSMPENLLERRLRTFDPHFAVFSAGAAGWGNDQEYLALQEYFRRYRADIVLLWETFENDVWNNLFPTNLAPNGTPKPTFRLDNGRLVGPNFTMGEILVPAPPMKLTALYRRLFPVKLQLDEQWESGYPPPYAPLLHYEGAYKEDWDIAHSTAHHLDLSLENLETEKTHFPSFSPREARGCSTHST